MPHRSNQAVASQGRTPEPFDEPPRPRRLLVGWATALAALGVSTALVLLGLWLARIPLAEFFIGAALAERGAEADFHVVNLDFGGVNLRQVRFGSEASPDAAVARVEARWRWRGLSPRLESVRLVEPHVRLRVDTGGRVSAGALDRLREGPPAARRRGLPRFDLEIVDGRLRIEAPFGALEAPVRAGGTLGEDFSAVARIQETSLARDAYALEDGAAEVVVVSRDDAFAFRLSAALQSMVWSGARIEGASLRILGRAPLNLSRFDGEIAWRVATARTPTLAATQFAGAVGAAALTREDSFALADWETRVRASAATLTWRGVEARRPRFEARAEGVAVQGRGRWTLGADRFAGLAMVSNRPAAAGRLYMDEQRRITGDALITFADTALDAAAQRDLREAFPDFENAPIGPTFARAERALDAAADRFTLTVPLNVAVAGDGPRFSIVAPAEARAATGTLLRLTPLRRDAPALVMQWPEARLHGGVALELSGGGAPGASLLLDAVSWAPEAPFEADGTLTLANWRAANASIAADELSIAIAVQPRGGGRIDLRGPARLSGPLGGGELRDLVATLDLAIAWGGGWRVTSNSGCLPVRLGGLDVAGLSFANGGFALCPLSGALIAADRSRNLSGGFVMRQLALNGRMAGPGAQPARLSAANLVGRFGGRTGDVTLAVEADAPALAIEMAEARTLTVVMASLTGNARLADSWSVEGAFSHGTLTDPALPGAVSTIAGGWSAAPENDKPVIRVAAGEALLTANRPSTDAERPLFNPLRLVDVDGVLREGQIEADGAILLEERARQLAQFTAHHDVDAGVGAARVVAPDLVFGPDMQPYDVTERARGLVDNVVGPASAVADINWTRDDITGVGHVRLDGISLATATIPIVNDVRGQVSFDDVFALTTPPGQQLTIGALDLGVAVSNGRVRFQLLPEQRVSIEQAEFDFADGVLAMSPTTIRLGADETEFELSLRDVDAAALLTTLNVPDLTATGRLEGSFPLLLTRRTAYVRGGVVRARGEGGVLAYTGDAGANATGTARIAFDALRTFEYDALSLTLDGDLNGEVVSSIEFSGHNTGRPVDLGPITSIPGVGRVSVRGVPFAFNVRIAAPFRRLAQTAAALTDPIALLNQRENAEREEEVDPEAPPPR